MFTDLSGLFIGTVLASDKEKRTVKVFVPKLLPTKQFDDIVEYTLLTDSTQKINDLTMSVSDTVKHINYIIAKAMDTDEPLPEVGSKVKLRAIDQDPNQIYWEKFNPNGLYTVIDEEKYKKLYTFILQNSTEEIFEKDSLELIFPEYFKIVNTSKDKTHKIELKENFNFYKPGSLVDVINNLQKSVEYTETTVKKRFIKVLDKVVSEDIETTKLLDAKKELASNEINSAPELLTADEIFEYYGSELAIISGLKAKYDAFMAAYTSASSDVKTALKTAFNDDFDHVLQSRYNKINELLKDDKFSDNGLSSIKERIDNELELSYKFPFTYKFIDGIETTITETATCNKLSENPNPTPSHTPIISAFSKTQFLGWSYKFPYVFDGNSATPKFFGLYLEANPTENTVLLKLANDDNYTITSEGAYPLDITEDYKKLASGELSELEYSVTGNETTVTLKLIFNSETLQIEVAE